MHTRKSTGKRKSSEQQGEWSSQAQRQRQQTISDLFSNNRGRASSGQGERNNDSTSSSNKRSRLFSPSPATSSSSPQQQTQTPAQEELAISTKMYNFGTAVGGSTPDDAGGSPLGRRSPATAAGPSSSAAAIKAAGGRPPPFSASLTSSRPSSNFSPHTGAKRLVVKNLRTEPRFNQESYFDKVWTRLDAALSAVFEDRVPEISLEELYKGAENVCRQGRAAALAKKLQDRCREYVSGKLRRSLVAKAEKGGSNINVLQAVIEAWSAWRSKLVCAKKKEREEVRVSDSRNRLPFAVFSTTLTNPSFCTPRSWL